MSQSRPKRPKKNDTQLEIQARPCTIYVSTSIDAYFENKRHLIPWNGEDSRMIDRYDARNLLQSITQWKNPHTPKKQLLSSEERELDKERYSDLFHKPTEEEEDDDEDQEEESISPIRKTAASKSSSSDSSAFRAVPFVYTKEESNEQLANANNNNNNNNSTSGKVSGPNDLYTPPFPLPKEITPASSEKEHQIVFRTAKYIADQGEKAELLLKLKHSNNPNFKFLLDQSPLHPYYAYIRDNIQTIEAWLDVTNKNNKKQEELQKPAEQEHSPISTPPAELKDIIDKLATYVEKHGSDFEDKVKMREKDNPKFQFLNPTHHYHAYYLSKINKGIETKVEEGIGKQEKDLNPSTSQEQIEEADAEKKKKEERLKKSKLLMKLLQQQQQSPSSEK